MKIKFAVQFLLLAFVMFSCAGDPSVGGIPDNCYATVVVTPSSPNLCEEGSDIGFYFRFEDQLGNVYYFNRNRIVNSPGEEQRILVALPRGQIYSLWVYMDYDVPNDCAVAQLDLSFEITGQGTCAPSTSVSFDNRIPVCCGPPDAAIYLDECNGCDVIVRT